MRISDWSSDVCSSDLRLCGVRVLQLLEADQLALGLQLVGVAQAGAHHCVGFARGQGFEHLVVHVDQGQELHAGASFGWGRAARRRRSHRRRRRRSEEHTSELQSLMRISYAVFCLKKKKTQSVTYQSNPYMGGNSTQQNCRTRHNHMHYMM